MNIKKEYIEKTREYLDKMDSKHRSIGELKKEIEVIKHSDNAYLDFCFDAVGIKSQGPTKTLADMVISKEQMIFIKEAEIDHINKKYETVKEMLSNLEVDEANVIEYRYFKKNKSKKQYTIKEIAKKLSYSIATVKRKELKAIKTLAVKIYGEDAVLKSEPKLSHMRAIQCVNIVS